MGTHRVPVFGSGSVDLGPVSAGYSGSYLHDDPLFSPPVYIPDRGSGVPVPGSGGSGPVSELPGVSYPGRASDRITKTRFPYQFDNRVCLADSPPEISHLSGSGPCCHSRQFTRPSPPRNLGCSVFLGVLSP